MHKEEYKYPFEHVRNSNNFLQITSQDKKESVKKDYDIIADQYAEEFGKVYEDIEVIEAFLDKLKPNSKILDLGGGTGKLTDLFIKKGHEAICYDFSKEMMRKAKEFYPDLPYILDDIVNMKKHFKNNTFDGIIAFYSLFHIPKEEVQKVFASINDLLKNNGIFCFVVQLGNGEHFIDEPYLKDEGKKVLYFNFFTEESINKILISNKFEVLFKTTKSEVGENELGEDGNDKVFIIARKKNYTNNEIII